MNYGLVLRPSYHAVFTIKPLEVHVLTVRRASQDAVTTANIESNSFGRLLSSECGTVGKRFLRYSRYARFWEVR